MKSYFAVTFPFSFSLRQQAGKQNEVASFVKYSRTSIIPISRLSGLFLWSQFGYDYLLVTIKIRSHILFKTTAFKCAVKREGFCSQRAKAALALVVSNEEHSNIVSKGEWL